MRVIIVDDSRAVHALVKDMLKDYTIEWLDAYNGQEAVDLLKSDTAKIDFALLDWEMPVLNGIESLPQMKAAKPDMPIVMMTSRNAMSDFAQAIEKGALDYIIKPFTKEIINERLKQLGVLS